MAFSNGVYEIFPKKSREGRKEDLITKTTKYKFPVNEDYGYNKNIQDF